MSIKCGIPIAGIRIGSDMPSRSTGSNGPVMSPADFVEQCLDQMGPLPVSDNTRKELVSQAQTEGDINWEGSPEDSARRTGDMLALIGSTREYQFG